MAAREIFPVRFASRQVGPTGAEMNTFTTDNPYRAEREGVDVDPKLSPAPESAEYSQPEAREITPVQGMNNSPATDLPPITKVRKGTDPSAAYGSNLPKAVPVEGEPETALEKRAEDPTDEAVQGVSVQETETALSAEEKKRAQQMAALEKARAAKAAKQGKTSPPDAPEALASAEKAAQTDEDGLVF